MIPPVPSSLTHAHASSSHWWPSSSWPEDFDEFYNYFVAKLKAVHQAELVMAQQAEIVAAQQSELKTELPPAPPPVEGPAIIGR